jgi:acyl-CoA reductase-like NAD-dependent aldehyde dehydrogenase
MKTATKAQTRTDENIFNVQMLIGAEWRSAATQTEIRDPYRGDLVAVSPESTGADVQDAVAAALAKKAAAAATPAYKRAALLHKVAALMRTHTEELAEIMARETGKAIKDGRAEVQRSIDTVVLSAEEAVRIEGEQVPLDASAMGAGKIAFLLRFPVGVVAGITPFNAPLNLACHKIAPAIAAGNTIVLKASPQAPTIVYRLSQLFMEAGLEPGVLNVLYGKSAGPALVSHPDVDFISFTGSTRAGLQIKATSGIKKVALELGGTGTTAVHDDADVKEVAAMCARNSMRLAGQSCISVQNVYVHEKVIDEFTRTLVDEVGKMKIGDPLDNDTDVGTLVDEGAAMRVEEWLRDAQRDGATLLCGGKRKGAAIEPAVVTNVAPTMKVVCQEVFGPVISILPYSDIGTVFDAVNRGEYGLQFGVCSKRLDIAFRAIREVRAGGIIINGTSTWRTDQLAYGGVKNSGLGREGPKYALRDMCEERLVVFNQ